MYNWDYNLPQNWQPRTGPEWIWYLERLVNYGLNGQKLPKDQLAVYLPKLKIANGARAFLELLLWNKKY